MKVQIELLKNCSNRKARGVRGDVLDVADRLAALLISHGVARLAGVGPPLKLTDPVVAEVQLAAETPGDEADLERDLSEE